MTPETKAELLRAVTDFYEAMRAGLDGAELDQSERKALFDFVQAVHDAATELKRKTADAAAQLGRFCCSPPPLKLP